MVFANSSPNANSNNYLDSNSKCVSLFSKPSSQSNSITNSEPSYELSALEIKNQTASTESTQKFLSLIKDLTYSRSTTNLNFDFFKKTIVVVDGYSSGNQFALRFGRLGYQIIHIHSRGKPKKSLQRTFNPNHYNIDFAYIDGTNGLSTNFEQILTALKYFPNVLAVIPGADYGVTLADHIADELHQLNPMIPADLIPQSLEGVKKNKYLQSELLRSLGISAVLQLKTKSVSEAVAWVKEKALFKNGPKKVIIKPLNSAGGDGLSIARNQTQLKAAIRKILGKPDNNGIYNAEVLVQEYLEGDEYVLNTTSLDGHLVVTDIWKYVKSETADGSSVIYDHDYLLPFDGEIQRQVREYGIKVLNALGQKNFNGHMEIKLVPGRGPVLVEHNARMMGAGTPLIVEKATGFSQIDRTLLAIENPAAFKQLPQGYVLNKHAVCITMTNPLPGRKLHPNIDQYIQSLPGYNDHHIHVARDKTLDVTVDLTTHIGEIVLIGSESEVEAGVQYYQELLKQNLITIP